VDKSDVDYPLDIDAAAVRERDAPERRLVFVGNLPPHPGGTAISAFQLLLALAHLGYSIRSLSPVTEGSRDQARRFDVRYPALHVCRYVQRRYDPSGPIPPPPSSREAERRALHEHLPPLLAAGRPAVVIAGRELFGWDVPGIAARHRVPSIVLLRGGLRSNAFLEGRYPPALTRQLLAGLRRACRLIAVSRHVAAGFARLGLAHIETIPNFVDRARFAPRPKDPAVLASLSVPRDAVVVMLVANLKPQKRPLDFVAAAARTAPRDPRLVYVVVGAGPLGPAMVRRSAELGLSGRFRFTGWIDYDTVPAHLAAADLVVLPSAAEGLARIYLETQAAGRVLLASDIPPAREVIQDGTTGYLFPLGDAEALASLTLHVARDAALRDRIGAAARRATDAYDLDRAARAYAVVIDDVVRERPRDRPGPRLRTRHVASGVARNTSARVNPPRRAASGSGGRREASARGRSA
jgi:glycosyltransferase involved in cell wall biosynthesis